MLPPRLKKRPHRTERLRSPGHLRFVRSHSCSVEGCGGLPIEAAHVWRGSQAGKSQKPDDCHAISLCAEHHKMQHCWGERAFERVHCIDMVEVAKAFWQASPHRRKHERAA